jgi:hypothetical protein
MRSQRRHLQNDAVPPEPIAVNIANCRVFLSAHAIGISSSPLPIADSQDERRV